jgi:hypothetical protein
VHSVRVNGDEHDGPILYYIEQRVGFTMTFMVLSADSVERPKLVFKAKFRDGG